MIEFEHEASKIASLTDRAVVLTAGDAIKGSKIAREVKVAIPANATIQQIANQTTEHYAKLRDAQVEIDQFRSRGLTREKFYKGESPLLNNQSFFAIDQYVMAYNYGVDLLLAGVDDEGAHIFYCGHPPGTCLNMRQIGYHAVGAGGWQAIQSLIGFSHAATKKLADTVFAVYASKRRAEAAPGVGKGTDLAIIDSGGTRFLSGEQLEELGKVYDNFVKPIDQESLKRVSKLLVDEKNAERK